MLPTTRELAKRHGAFCLKKHIKWSECDVELSAALALAEHLTEGRAEDEPAALLYTLSLPARALGDAWLAFPLEQALRLGREAGLRIDLQPDDVDLMMLLLAVMDPRLGVGFPEVRAFVAARTRPAHLRVVK